MIVRDLVFAAALDAWRRFNQRIRRIGHEAECPRRDFPWTGEHLRVFDGGRVRGRPSRLEPAERDRCDRKVSSRLGCYHKGEKHRKGLAQNPGNDREIRRSSMRP